VDYSIIGGIAIYLSKGFVLFVAAGDRSFEYHRGLTARYGILVRFESGSIFLLDDMVWFIEIKRSLHLALCIIILLIFRTVKKVINQYSKQTKTN